MIGIDCDTHFGTLPAPTYDTSLDALIRAEKAEGVGYVMACSLTGRVYDAREGNYETLAVSRSNPEVLPVATVDPRACYGVEEEIARAAKAGFVALRVFPEHQGWSIDSELFTMVADACARHSLPLMVSTEAQGKPSQALRAAGESQCPIILLNANYPVQGEALYVLERRPNTYLCSRFFVTPYAYEEAVKRVGAERLVFGTDAPANGIRQVVSVIMRSSLSDADKKAILGGNILGLIAPQLRKLRRSLPEGELEPAYARKCVKGGVIDVHGHVGPWPFPMRGRGIGDVQDLMKRRGLQKCVVSSTRAIVSDFITGNAELAEALRECPDVYGYVTVNPNCPEESICEIDKYLADPKFVGLKMHPAYSRSPIDGEGALRIARRIEGKGVPFLIHTMGPGECARIGRLAEQIPDVPIIMGHGGAAAWRESLGVVRNTGNTYVEFCCSTEEYGKIRQVLDAVGPERVMFGSDLGLFDPAYNLGTYEEAGLTPEEEAAVMRDNAQRLFRFA